MPIRHLPFYQTAIDASAVGKTKVVGTEKTCFEGSGVHAKKATTIGYHTWDADEADTLRNSCTIGFDSCEFGHAAPLRQPVADKWCMHSGRFAATGAAATTGCAAAAAAAAGVAAASTAAADSTALRFH